MNDNWLGLIIGNSRLHWALFKGNYLDCVWDSNHLTTSIAIKSLLGEHYQKCPLYIASVVPQQTKFWQHYPDTKIITLDDIPLQGIYSTMGIDRALALWGAGYVYNFPCLVIDGGTALTFTGADSQGKLVGGAILPGLNLQLHSLTIKTAALPQINLTSTNTVNNVTKLPPRWGRNTPEAIASGIIYTLLAGIEGFITDWVSQFPDSKIIFTGGDGALLRNYLLASINNHNIPIIFDSNLSFFAFLSLFTEL